MDDAASCWNDAPEGDSMVTTIQLKSALIELRNIIKKIEWMVEDEDILDETESARYIINNLIQNTENESAGI